MNTTKTGMRSILVAAAAGALVLGSAAGVAVAKPAAKPAAKGQASYLQLKKVDIHRHSAINVHPSAVARDLKVRATVRDTSKDVDPVSVTVVLAGYSKKRGAPNSSVTEISVPLTLVKEKKKEKDYAFVVPGKDIKAAVDANNWQQSATVFLCIKSADMAAPDPLPAGVTVKADAKRVTVKENAGDCVRVVNVDPTMTQTATDDPTS